MAQAVKAMLKGMANEQKKKSTMKPNLQIKEKRTVHNEEEEIGEIRGKGKQKPIQVIL